MEARSAGVEIGEEGAKETEEGAKETNDSLYAIGAMKGKKAKTTPFYSGQILKFGRGIFPPLKSSFPSDGCAAPRVIERPGPPQSGCLHFIGRPRIAPHSVFFPAQNKHK
jgi:hypothetical protein